MFFAEYYGDCSELSLRTIQIATYFFLELLAHSQDKSRKDILTRYATRYILISPPPFQIHKLYYINLFFLFRLQKRYKRNITACKWVIKLFIECPMWVSDLFFSCDVEDTRAQFLLLLVRILRRLLRHERYTLLVPCFSPPPFSSNLF